MDADIKFSTPRARLVHWSFWFAQGMLGVGSAIRGIGRILDGHPASGWLMAMCGAGMALNASWLLWQVRSAQHTR